MNQIYKDSIQTAKELSLQIKDGAHDISHAKRVSQNVSLICKELSFKNEGGLLELCAWWHDTGRLYNPNHEKLSAKMLNEDLKARGVSYRVRKRAFLAIYKHRWRMHPRTIEGRILRDADKLDFISTDRWQKCENTNNHRHNLKILRLLPKLRKMLYFPASRKIYDSRLKEFSTYLASQNIKARF